MRSNKDFIEIHGARTKNSQLINKRAIIFVVKGFDETNYCRAVIHVTSGGDHVYKIDCEESYKDVTEELLWNPIEEDENV